MGAATITAMYVKQGKKWRVLDKFRWPRHRPRRLLGRADDPWRGGGYRGRPPRSALWGPSSWSVRAVSQSRSCVARGPGWPPSWFRGLAIPKITPLIVRRPAKADGLDGRATLYPKEEPRP
jgi:hypothetical protein